MPDISYYRAFNAAEGQQLRLLEMSASESQRVWKEQGVELLAAQKEEARRDIAISAGTKQNNIPYDTVSNLQWRRESGDIHTYQDTITGGFVHVDTKGQFYDQRNSPISVVKALEDRKVAPEVFVPSHQIRQHEQHLPSSLFAGQLSRGTILQDLREIPYDELRVATKHENRNADIGSSLVYGYAKSLAGSWSNHRDWSADEHIAAVQPTAEERKRWEPLVKAVGIYEASSYIWKQESDGIQSYRNNQTLSYIHVDSQGQTYNRHGQTIGIDRAIDQANTSQAREPSYLSVADQYRRAELHYAPLNETLPEKVAEKFTWKTTTNSIQSYEHVETHRHIHIDGETLQFYDQNKKPISQSTALEHAQGKSSQTQLQRETISQGVINSPKEIDSQGYGRGQ